jgi:hypothetical protein
MSALKVRQYCFPTGYERFRKTWHAACIKELGVNDSRALRGGFHDLHQGLMMKLPYARTVISLISLIVPSLVLGLALKKSSEFISARGTSETERLIYS